jgi:uncharacterized membrane protein
MTIGMAIVLVAGVYFLIISRGFRMFAGVVCVAAVIAVIWIVYSVSQSNEQSSQRQAAERAQQERMAATAIKAEELSFRNVAVQRPSYDPNGRMSPNEWLLTGTVTNNSARPLADVTFEITVLDCPDASRKDCLTVGRKQTTAAVRKGYGETANVPPGQTRALSSYAIRFEGIPDTPQGYSRKFVWKLDGVRAAWW